MNAICNICKLQYMQIFIICVKQNISSLFIMQILSRYYVKFFLQMYIFFLYICAIISNKQNI